MKSRTFSAQQLQLNLAISRNVILPGIENWVLAPVKEFSFVNDNPISAESSSYGFIPLGFQDVSPHVKFEGLYQIAVNSSQTGGVKSSNKIGRASCRERV